MPRKSRDYPTPCLRENPTGEGVILELPSGVTTPFADMATGEAHVYARGLARSFGKVYAQVPGTKRFYMIDEDDGLDID